MGLFSPQISTKTMVPVCRQLATTYEAGIPILKGLELVSEQLGDQKARRVLQHMKENIQNGATLGEAARVHRRHLPPFFIELLASGEAGGRLDIMLKDLAQYFEDRLVMMRRFMGAMIYPGVQLVFAWFFGTFALRLVGQIDFTGGTAFSFERYLVDYAFFQAKAMLVFGAIVLVCAALSYFGALRWISGWVSNFIWPLRPISRKFGLARFFRSMSLLVGSGMNMRSCIQNSAAITLNPYMQRDLLKAVPPISQGATLVEAFSHTRYLSPVSREMILVGEQSGNLEESLRKVSDYHLEEATHLVQVLTRLLGVLIVVAVAGIIGYFVISFYTKLYSGIGVF
jgi:type IV pilus assembly protein PilC